MWTVGFLAGSVSEVTPNTKGRGLIYAVKAIVTH